MDSARKQELLKPSSPASAPNGAAIRHKPTAPTGTAKITPAYNLPSRHVIHTVGPIANGRPTGRHCEQLASRYRSCLDLAAANGLASIAFCCISTGVFGFPQRGAAEIAVRTVRKWLGAHEDAGVTVVFNVFGEEDEAIYRALLL